MDGSRDLMRSRHAATASFRCAGVALSHWLNDSSGTACPFRLALIAIARLAKRNVRRSSVPSSERSTARSIAMQGGVRNDQKPRRPRPGHPAQDDREEKVKIRTLKVEGCGTHATAHTQRRPVEHPQRPRPRFRNRTWGTQLLEIGSESYKENIGGGFI